MSREQVVEALRKAQGNRSLRQFAKDIGVTAAYLSDIYRGRRDPGPKVCRAVGVVKRVERRACAQYVKSFQSVKI